MITFRTLFRKIKNTNRQLVYIVITAILLVVTQKFTFSQTTKHKHSLLRVYEDNDFINVRGKGTDRWYSHGFRLDFFSERRNKVPGFPFPKAGQGSINTYGWGIMQIFITPSDLSKKFLMHGLSLCKFASSYKVRPFK